LGEEDRNQIREKKENHSGRGELRGGGPREKKMGGKKFAADRGHVLANVGLSTVWSSGGNTLVGAAD